MTASRSQIEARILRHAWRVSAFQRLILAWFRRNGRTFPWRAVSTTRYAQIVSELLLQRTRAETVATFFPRFVKRFPGWSALAEATETDLRTFLEPIGLWRRRATTLQDLAREMQKRRGRFPATRKDIEALPGVGQYIANATLMFCHRAREPLLDVNMARVLERCFAPRKLVDIRHDPWLQALARAVVNHDRAREINWAVLDLAATICRPRNPRCGVCPLNTCCRFGLARLGSARKPSGQGSTTIKVTISRHHQKIPAPR